jgi:hypothetical protein
VHLPADHELSRHQLASVGAHAELIERPIIPLAVAVHTVYVAATAVYHTSSLLIFGCQSGSEFRNDFEERGYVVIQYNAPTVGP